MEVATRDHDRARADHVLADGRLEPTDGALERSYFRTEAKRQSHLLRVALLIVGDLVFVRERIVAARERDPRQAVEVARREEAQRVSARTPGVAHALVRIDEKQLAPGAYEVVRDRETGVACAHDEDIRVRGPR